MHELSIATSLVELAAGAAADAGIAQVSAVHLRLGALSGVVRDALLFSFEVASSGTPLAGARLLIEEVPVQIHCAACDSAAVLPDARRLRCPSCGRPTASILAGRELDLVALEYEDAPQPAAPEIAGST